MRSPWSQRAAKAGGLAQNSTYRCSGDPGCEMGVAFLATAVGGPVKWGETIKGQWLLFGHADKQGHTRVVVTAAVPRSLFDCWWFQ